MPTVMAIEEMETELGPTSSPETAADAKLQRVYEHEISLHSLIASNLNQYVRTTVLFIDQSHETFSNEGLWSRLTTMCRNAFKFLKRSLQIPHIPRSFTHKVQARICPVCDTLIKDQVFKDKDVRQETQVADRTLNGTRSADTKVMNTGWKYEPQSFTITAEVILADQKSLTMDVAPLRRYSKFFAKAFSCSSQFIEAQRGRVELPEVELSSFTVFKNWLETGHIEDSDTLLPKTKEFCSIMSQDNVSKMADDSSKWIYADGNGITFGSVDKRLERLTDCYILGDFLFAPGFQNDVIGLIMAQYAKIHSNGGRVPLYNIEYVCQSTTPRNPLRRLLVDTLFAGLRRETLDLIEEKDILPREIIENVANARAKYVGWYSPSSTFGSIWVYHSHPRGEWRSPCGNSCCPMVERKASKSRVLAVAEDWLDWGPPGPEFMPW